MTATAAQILDAEVDLKAAYVAGDLPRAIFIAGSAALHAALGGRCSCMACTETRAAAHAARRVAPVSA